MSQGKNNDLTQQQRLAAFNREVALYYKLTRTLSRNLNCPPEEAMGLLELPGNIRKQISARLANETKRPGKCPEV